VTYVKLISNFVVFQLYKIARLKSNGTIKIL